MHTDNRTSRPRPPRVSLRLLLVAATTLAIVGCTRQTTERRTSTGAQMRMAPSSSKISARQPYGFSGRKLNFTHPDVGHFKTGTEGNTNWSQTMEPPLRGGSANGRR